MTAIVKTVLNSDPNIKAATDSYIDDIVINEDLISVEEVKRHLKKFNLDVKEPESLGDARVLGLRTFKSSNNVVMWKRDNPAILDEILRKEMFTKKELFSVTGKLLGHYPVCGWIRPCTSFIKRLTNDFNWEDNINPKLVLLLHELVNVIKKDNPVRGTWQLKNLSACTVWCDASSIATGVVLESENSVIEDASWLRKSDDANHINLAELESVVIGKIWLSVGALKI